MNASVTRCECNGSHIDVRLTPWDQCVLGFGTAEFTSFHAGSSADARSLLAQAATWGRANNVSYLFGRVPGDARELRTALTATGYSMVECSLTLSRDGFDHLPVIPPRVRIDLRPAVREDLASLQVIANDDFHHGRFLEDPAIAHADAARRTANWVSDLLDLRLLRTALCSGRIVGFHSERVGASGKHADLLLTGVANRYAVLAMSLWVSVLQDLARRDVRGCSTLVSAANIGVVNLYAALGFRYNSTLFGYRKFL